VALFFVILNSTDAQGAKDSTAVSCIHCHDEVCRRR
jgi:hypothetical protein